MTIFLYKLLIFQFIIEMLKEVKLNALEILAIHLIIKMANAYFCLV